jgi:hypothetical protein
LRYWWRIGEVYDTWGEGRMIQVRASIPGLDATGYWGANKIYKSCDH